MPSKVYRNLDTPEARAWWHLAEEDDLPSARPSSGICHRCDKPGVCLTHSVYGYTRRTRWEGGGRSAEEHEYFTLEALSNACSLECAQAVATEWIAVGNLAKVEVRSWVPQTMQATP